jgi:hypothetical protein
MQIGGRPTLIKSSKEVVEGGKVTMQDKWQGTICPNIFKKLKINIVRSGKCYMLWNGEDGFELQEREDKRYTIQLEQKTCRYWQLSGLPCCHAISAI